MARKTHIRMDSQTEQLPATLSADEERLIALAQKNTKFSRDEQVIPRLKMLQALSPEVQEGGPQYIEGAKAGMFYNTASGKLTPGAVGIVTCIIGYQRQTIEWVANEPGSGMVKNWGPDEGWKALCEPDQREAFQPYTKQGHFIDKQRQFLIFDVDVENGTVDPSFFNLRSTGNRVANYMSTLLSQARAKLSDGRIFNPPHYYYLYKLTLELTRNKNSQSWWMPKFTKYADKNGLQVKTQDIKNGKEIFEQAVLLQEQFMEGGIVQTEFEDTGNNTINDEVPSF